jgi:hypothetical protein
MCASQLGLNLPELLLLRPRGVAHALPQQLLLPRAPGWSSSAATDLMHCMYMQQQASALPVELT